MYKEVYKTYIKNKEYIEDKTKQMLEADIKIKTTYIDNPKTYDEVTKKRFERQRKTIERL